MLKYLMGLFYSPCYLLQVTVVVNSSCAWFLKLLSRVWEQFCQGMHQTRNLFISYPQFITWINRSDMNEYYCFSSVQDICTCQIECVSDKLSWNVQIIKMGYKQRICVSVLCYITFCAFVFRLSLVILETPELPWSTLI
jgi:hypothetical protein